MSGKATDQVTTIGIDIGKNSFHLIGLDGAGDIVLRRKLSQTSSCFSGFWQPSGAWPMSASHHPRTFKAAG